MKAGEKLIDDLVKYEENYEIKREFMSESSVSPYSQIQNPKNQSEIITIRKCDLKASYADPNLSIDEMVKKGLQPENLVVSYETESRQFGKRYIRRDSLYGERQTKEFVEVEFK